MLDGAIIGVPMAARLAQRLGKRHAMVVIVFAGMAVYAASWWLYNPALPILQLGASGSIAFLSASYA